jgi:hypothetical protein
VVVALVTALAALALLALIAIGLVADEDGPPTAPGPVHVSLMDEIDPVSYFAGSIPQFEQDGVYWFVIEPESGRILGVRDDCRHEGGVVPPGETHCGIRRVLWLDVDTLQVETNVSSFPIPTGALDQAVYEVDLDGDVRRTDEMPPERNPTPTPAPQVSADSAWTFAEVENLGSFQGATFTREEVSLVVSSGTSALELTSIARNSARWSPTAEKLAFIGNHCVAFDVPERYDLLILDPETGVLTNLTQGTPDTIRYFGWHPSGDSIAATAVGRNTPHRVLLLDAGGGKEETLLESTLGYFMPEGWSPNGRWLLVQFNGGGDWCNGPVSAAAPTSLVVR